MMFFYMFILQQLSYAKFYFKNNLPVIPISKWTKKKTGFCWLRTQDNLCNNNKYIFFSVRHECAWISGKPKLINT